MHVSLLFPYFVHACPFSYLISQGNKRIRRRALGNLPCWSNLRWLCDCRWQALTRRVAAAYNVIISALVIAVRRMDSSLIFDGIQRVYLVIILNGGPPFVAWIPTYSITHVTVALLSNMRYSNALLCEVLSPLCAPWCYCIIDLRKNLYFVYKGLCVAGSMEILWLIIRYHRIVRMKNNRDLLLLVRRNLAPYDAWARIAG